MIALDHISTKACSTCGARPAAAARKDQHCNGHWNEYVTYACGHKLHFSPNFMRVVVIALCPHTEGEVARRENNRTYLNALIALAQQHPKAEEKLRAQVLRDLEGLMRPYVGKHEP